MLFRKRHQGGFTLLEIMLVLVLLSVSAVAVISTLPQSQSDETKQQAQRLYQRLQLFNEEAMLAGKDFGIRVDEAKKQYVFLELKQDGWQRVSLSKIPEETTLPEALSIKLDLSTGIWGNDDRLFEPGSLFDEDMFADVEKEKKQEKPPQVFILSSGEITAGVFVLAPVNRARQDQTWYVEVEESGHLALMDVKDWNEKER
ncbi:type II secretion system minor pseudopilin GspH [Vibrio sp. SCSIO 43140]|uniref:type II secretion system minor pseudopilin GspH n=1 Tax=Vibrio sp. SCSIO 43140 TaxID=2819100 RepID=UPI00207533D5|nr:type II secretion system minor pseudopilin GspH [Vibrio sp. SCSIO 43140]USD60602.1 type II secretion system minor pseudopilin GspH [Vibrio sp. SCSIO 43140]